MQEKEKVLVVPRSELFFSGPFHGYSSGKIPETLEVIRTKSFFMDREAAEQDSSRKQIIPYAVLEHREKIFVVKRLSTQSESRLHRKISIGIGGHVNPCDVEEGRLIWESGLERELLEEVWIQDPWERELTGFINDDSVPVGSVHFGLVYRIKLSSSNAGIREKEKMTGSFLPPEEVVSSYEAMETWSRFAFSSLFPEFSSVAR